MPLKRALCYRSNSGSIDGSRRDSTRENVQLIADSRFARPFADDESDESDESSDESSDEDSETDQLDRLTCIVCERAFRYRSGTPPSWV